MTIVAVSDGYLRATRTRREALLGRSVFDVFPAALAGPAGNGADDLRCSLERVQRTRAADVMAPQAYAARRPPDDEGAAEEGYWQPSNTPVLGPDGRLRYILHRLDDVTELMRAKRALRAAQVAGDGLDMFTTSVSHDLRAPLRHMLTYMDFMFEDYSAQLPPGALADLQAVQRSTRKMTRFVEGLLTLAYFSRKPLNRTLVAPAGIVSQVLGERQAELKGRPVEIAVGDLPPVLADEALLGEVYRQLIGNALNFSRPRQPARLEIGSRPEDGQMVYFVRDNGLGFDMQSVSRIFEPFQRLHELEGDEGIGIGLPIVDRIVTRHGGRVWAEAAEDQGATFFFTLSAPPD